MRKKTLQFSPTHVLMMQTAKLHCFATLHDHNISVLLLNNLAVNLLHTGYPIQWLILFI